MSTCSVMDCERPASTSIPLHPRQTYGLTAGPSICGDHNYEIIVDGAAWAHIPGQGILIGSALDQAGLFVVDQATSEMHVDWFLSSTEGVGRIVLIGRSPGSLEQRKIEIPLTPDVARDIAGAVSMWAKPDSP